MLVSHLLVVKLRAGAQNLLLLLGGHHQLVVAGAHVGVGLKENIRWNRKNEEEFYNFSISKVLSYNTFFTDLSFCYVTC